MARWDLLMRSFRRILRISFSVALPSFSASVSKDGLTDNIRASARDSRWFCQSSQ